MKFRRGRLGAFLGYLGFFFVVAGSVTAGVLVYDKIKDESSKTVVITLIGIIILVSALCTLIDYFRRKRSLEEPVEQILEATEKISSGDFSVFVAPRHAPSRYDEFDCILENINKMAASLTRNEALHADFISNVSHEIKTPLAIIQNYATLLQSAQLPEAKRKEYLGTLVSASKRLSDLVVNVLKLNKLENQDVKPEYESVRLNAMLENSILQYEDVIEQKGLELECDLSDITVFTAPSYLEIVWNNLLSNAVKFTPTGGKISVSLKSEQGYAVVRVSDTGCGISPEVGERIFEKFYQGDTSHAKEGNGLGLALVKKVIDVLGGEISVVSEAGKGSTFSVRLKAEGECH